MARLLPCLSFGPSSPSASTHSISPVPILVLRLQRHIIPQPRSFNGVRVSSPSSLVDRRVLIARASSETDGNEGGEPGDTPPEQSQEAVSVENLPLESKLQLKLEQKLKMKLAKKIRLRRKRLLRKRRMRKKGRWPPSKMKKLKNV
ncbi:50S ribosomal protein 5 alpha, chloroplastic-like [Zingiber officinale]|uniref:50S ribosomal protein 5 alpha, chloroplastic-like n=1 Tax=Zingiber officinale TaxID=94328 RepID=UPI001C4DBAF8|nr:50S ribosomal protein 5 alpha, chloroplastic-like [Zingiber officinale]